MKRNYKILLLFLFQQHYLHLKSEVDPNPDKDKLLLELLTFVLEKDTIVQPL
jgi:carboxyl-terminal processing protease